MDDNAPPLEEIGEYNQSARRGGLVKDQDRGVLAVRDLDGAHPVGRGGQPGRLDVERQKPASREDAFQFIKRGVSGGRPQICPTQPTQPTQILINDR